MKNYKFKFLGVVIGSIGKQQKFTKTIQAENIQEAKLKLYDTHEHIFILSVNDKPINKDYDFAEHN
jgi:ribosomal protein L20A (L18A)